jgi:hypothetical protein
MIPNLPPAYSSSLKPCLGKTLFSLALIGCLLAPGLAHAVDAPTAHPEAAPASTPNPVDVVTLKDGSVIYGEIVDMMNGELFIKTAFGVGDIVKVKWASVAKLTVTHPLPFHLKEGTVLVGTAEEGEGGTMIVKAEPLAGSLSVPLDSVISINPLVQPAVVYVGSLQGGFSKASGNSHVTNASLIGEFTGRSESLRLTILGRFIYSDDSGQLLVRNSRGTVKLDFFITKKLYWFASSYFEQDTFQDLKLRTAITSGPGYQFIDKGDYESPWRKDMTLYAEAGVATSMRISITPQTKRHFADAGRSNSTGRSWMKRLPCTTSRKDFRRCKIQMITISRQTPAPGSRSSQAS